MKAKDFLKTIKYLPFDMTTKKVASNSAIYRWLENGSVNINGEYPKPNDEIVLPVNKLVFFKGKSATTYMLPEWLKLNEIHAS